MVGTVDRFRRELGVSASFIAESQEVLLPPRVCTELVRIVQEALANVRKHSGAHKVRVVFGRENGHYKLCVEDDGRGFGFTGRLSSPALDASSNCPVVIKERVDAIGGELMIESVPGSGARLEILVPLTHNDRVSSDD
jgi:two-component system, NarL family, nitrate/nitrite sensor histidine kinase NarX